MASGTASPNYFSTLVANTVDTVTVPAGWNRCEILNRSGTAEIFYTADGSTPTVGGSNCRLLPASISVDDVPLQYNASTTIQLISTGTPTYAIMVNVE